MFSLQDRNWMAFHLTDLFDSIQRGKRLKRGDQQPGTVPYVSSSALNNGVDGFIAKAEGCRVFSDCISLANSGSVGSAFYEPFEFVASDHVTHLKRGGLSRECYLFIVAVLGKQASNFNFNREINDRRIQGMQVMLPTDMLGEPDWKFMEDYIREREQVQVERCRNFLLDRIASIERERESNRASRDLLTLAQENWTAFSIKTLFESFQPGKSHGRNHLSAASEGGIEYIGATNRNNGVLCHVKLNDRSKSLVQQGNCIGFIKNGDGSAGYAIYKLAPFISTSDVIYGYASWLNEFTGLFFVAAQDLISSKYSHGHKRTRERLLNDRVMLPALNSTEPDFDCMESYGRMVTLRLLKMQLAHLN